MKILFAVYFSNFSCPSHFNDFRNFLGGTTQHTHCGNIYEWLIQKRIFLNRGEMQESSSAIFLRGVFNLRHSDVMGAKYFRGCNRIKDGKKGCFLRHDVLVSPLTTYWPQNYQKTGASSINEITRQLEKNWVLLLRKLNWIMILLSSWHPKSWVTLLTCFTKHYRFLFTEKRRTGSQVYQSITY